MTGPLPGIRYPLGLNQAPQAVASRPRLATMASTPRFRVSCGSSHSCVLATDERKVFVFGEGEDGQLGLGDAEKRLAPKLLEALANEWIDDVCCGAEHTIAMSRRNNRVFSWGWGDFGRLAQGDKNDIFLPRPVQAFEGVPVRSIVCGDTHCLAVLEAGGVLAWGRNSNGQCGLGMTDDVYSPRVVTALQGVCVTSAACGAEHSVVSTSTGSVYSFGWGSYGNLGLGDTQDRHIPEKVTALEGKDVRLVACGWRHSAAVTREGDVFTFGWSKYGQLGHGDNEDQHLPKQLTSLGEKVDTVAGGWRHTVAVTVSGKLYSWGWNRFGQLGLGSMDDSNVPSIVTFTGDDSPTVHVACGWRHTLAVLASGSIFSWGRGASGQLGHGDTEELLGPKPIRSLMAPEQAGGGDGLTVTYIPPAERYALVPERDGVAGEGPPAKKRAVGAPPIGAGAHTPQTA